MTTHDGAPHGRGMAWATLLVSGGISWGVNLWHAFDQVPGGKIDWWYGSIAVLYGTAPVVLAALQSHSAAFNPLGHRKRIVTYVLMLLGMILSIKAQAIAVEPFTEGEMRWLFPVMVDLSAFLALHTLMSPQAAPPVEPEPLLKPLPLDMGEPWHRHVICKGSSDGTLFLVRPTRKKAKPAPIDLGVETGQRVHDLATVLGGHHSPVVYFLLNGDRVKIGTSTHLRPRIRRLALRVDNLALVLAGDARFEAELHERFASYRDGDTEWFEMSGDVAAFVEAGGQRSVAGDSAALATTGGSASSVLATGDATTGGASGGRSGDSEMGELAPVPRQRQPRSGGAKSRAGGGRKQQRTRRSMTEWVALAEPLWHEETARLRRQPTGEEFAEAIGRAGLGQVSASTAKNIRMEILDRQDVPALDDLASDS
jgi:hypothetical protein